MSCASRTRASTRMRPAHFGHARPSMPNVPRSSAHVRYRQPDGFGLHSSSSSTAGATGATGTIRERTLLALASTPSVTHRVRPLGRNRCRQAREERERIEIDRHGAIGKRALERDPHQAVRAGGDAFLRDRRAEHVLDERLACSRIESAYARCRGANRRARSVSSSHRRVSQSR